MSPLSSSKRSSEVFLRGAHYSFREPASDIEPRGKAVRQRFCITSHGKGLTDLAVSNVVSELIAPTITILTSLVRFRCLNTLEKSWTVLWCAGLVCDDFCLWTQQFPASINFLTFLVYFLIFSSTIGIISFKNTSVYFSHFSRTLGEKEDRYVCFCHTLSKVFFFNPAICVVC